MTRSGLAERLQRGERGQAGGIEVLPFGLLVFVAGTLLITNMWGVVDAKFATDAAAREAARWVVERAGTTTSADALHDGAQEVATRTMRDHGRRQEVTLTLSAPDDTFERCDRIQVTVEASVPALRVPFVGGYGDAFDVKATHSELVDPNRAGAGGTADCLS